VFESGHDKINRAVKLKSHLPFSENGKGAFKKSIVNKTSVKLGEATETWLGREQVIISREYR